jgi:hypothetical protein
MRRLLSASIAAAWLFVPSPVRAATIQAPLSGAVVTPGATVNITVAPGPGEVIEQVAFATRETAIALPPGQLTGGVPIPIDAVGPEFVIAFVIFANGQRAAPFVELIANPGRADDLEIGAPGALTAIGQMVQLDVRGRFADGVTRDVTHGDRGTTYQSSHPAVLAVDRTGMMQARTRGTAQILVTSHGVSRVVTVQVAVPSPPDNQIPVPNAGPDQTVQRMTVAHLTGAQSNDPDGQPLQYRWQQEAGPAVILRAPETAAPYFIAPFVRETTILEFSLVVIDSRGATSYPDTVRITVTP